MLAGDVVGHVYVLERLAGAGGMGQVWQARDRITGQRVGLKILHAGSEGLMQRFEREALVLETLDHRGIVPYVAHGTMPSGEPYLAMEWLEGEDLATRLLRGALGLEESLALAERVASALGHAHQAGIIHRDVKPANLFLAGGDLTDVTVLDFGLARYTTASAARVITHAGVVMGTVGYMAPEQAQGHESLDARADVFSLGCVLYECLTGLEAFGGTELVAVLTKVLFQPAPRVRDVRPELPPEVDALVARLLAKHPDQRPRDGQAAAEEIARLRAVLRGAAPSVRLTPVPYETRLVSLVLASDDAHGALRGVDGARLEELGRRHGVQVAHLADGSVAATSVGEGVAVDQVIRAARFALGLRALSPAAVVALATARGGVQGGALVGEVIDLATQLIDAARTDADLRRVGAIAIDDATGGLLEVRFEVARIGGVLGIRDERVEPQPVRHLLGRSTPCVGRERDLAVLDAAFDTCVGERRARAVVITASPGVGKSRIAGEWLRRLGQRVVFERLEARGDYLGEGAAFGVLARALRRASDIGDGEPLDLRRRKLHARVARVVPRADVPRVVDFLGELCDVPFPDELSVQLRAARGEPFLMADQIERAWKDYVAAACRQRPLVLVLDDLHWADGAIVRLVDVALRTLHDHPLLVVALARPEVHDLFPTLWQGRDVTTLRLGDLSRAASVDLVRWALGGDHPASEVDGVVDRAGGHAFYLEELVRAKVAGQTEWPRTVAAMVQARIDALPPDVRQVLRAASVFGTPFPLDGVRAVLGEAVAEEVTAQALAVLVDEEILVEGGRLPTYAFRHALLREGADATQADDDRAEGHLRAAIWLETQRDTRAAVLAEHFERGGNRGRAVGYYVEGVQEALEGADFAAVSRLAARGEACGASGEARGRLLLAQAEAHRWNLDFELARARAEEAFAWVPRAAPVWFEVAAELAAVYGNLGATEALSTLARTLVALPLDAPPMPPHVTTLARATAHLLARWNVSDVRPLIAWMDRFAPAIAARNPRVAARVHEMRAFQALREGDVWTYVLHNRASLSTMVEAGDVRYVPGRMGFVAYGDMLLGDYAGAERLLRKAIPMAESMGLESAVASLVHNLATAVFELHGPSEEAIELARRAVAIYEAHRYTELESDSHLIVARALMARGDLDGAEAECDLAIAQAEGGGFATHGPALLAEIALARGDAPRALAEATRAMVVLEGITGVRYEESFVRLTHAMALRAAGDLEAARRVIRAERERIVGVAARIDDATARARYLEAVTSHARTLSLARAWLEEPTD